MSDPAPTELVEEPDQGRVFERELVPGIADAAADGRVRLDAIARWLQDVAYLDWLDAGADQSGFWIIRRGRMRVERFPRFGETVTLRTFCSGLGRFSAERRTSIRGESALVEAVAIWVWIDAETGRPKRFPSQFVETYAKSAGGREAPVRLRHLDPSAGCERSGWSFRAVDVDVAGHVNNSHLWAPLEEELASSPVEQLDAEIEFREPTMPGQVTVLRAPGAMWIANAAGDRVTASLSFAD